MFGFIMDPEAHGVIFRQYVYYDDNNHPRTGTFISNYFPPSNPRTLSQQENRGKMRRANEHWKTLSAEEKREWDRKAQGKHMSGFNLHNRHFMETEEIMVPIGSIIAWHKNFAPPPIGELPSEWLECNGQVIDDPTSPYHGKTLPDLNGNKRFLRGNATSGTEQSDAFQGHKHTSLAFVWGNLGNKYQISVNPTPTIEYWSHLEDLQDGYTDDGACGTPRISTETRPVNMSVVWIMRIK